MCIFRLSSFTCIFSQYTYRHLNWEIILVDDNSPDGTQDIAKQLQGVYGNDRIVIDVYYFVIASNANVYIDFKTKTW